MPIIRIIFASFFVYAESIIELYSWVVGKGCFVLAIIQTKPLT
jgi:hypothetical protein